MSLVLRRILEPLPAGHTKTTHKEILEEQRGGTTGGHLGEDKTIQRLKAQLYWWTDVQNWCRSVTHVQRGRYLLRTDMQYSTVYRLVTQCNLSQLILWVCYLSVILETNASLHCCQRLFHTLDEGDPNQEAINTVAR